MEIDRSIGIKLLAATNKTSNQIYGSAGCDEAVVRVR